MVSAEDQEGEPPCEGRRRVSWRVRLGHPEPANTRAEKITAETFQESETTEDLSAKVNGDSTTLSSNEHSFREFSSVDTPHSEPEANNSDAAIKHVFLPKVPLLKLDLLRKCQINFSTAKLSRDNNSRKRPTVNNSRLVCCEDKFDKTISDQQIFKKKRSKNNDYIHLPQKRKREDIPGIQLKKRIKPRLSATIPETILFRNSESLVDNKNDNLDENSNKQNDAAITGKNYHVRTTHNKLSGEDQVHLNEKIVQGSFEPPAQPPPISFERKPLPKIRQTNDTVLSQTETRWGSRENRIKAPPKYMRLKCSKLRNTKLVNKGVERFKRKTVRPFKRIEQNRNKTGYKDNDFRCHNRADFFKKIYVDSLDKKGTNTNHVLPKVNNILEKEHSPIIETCGSVLDASSKAEELFSKLNNPKNNGRKSFKTKPRINNALEKAPDISKRESTLITTSAKGLDNKRKSMIVSIKLKEGQIKILNEMNIKTYKEKYKHCSSGPLELKVSIPLAKIKTEQLVFSEIRPIKDENNRSSNENTFENITVNRTHSKIQNSIKRAGHSKNDYEDTNVPVEEEMPGYYCIDNQDLPSGKLVMKLRRMSRLAENQQSETEIPKENAKYQTMKDLERKHDQANELREKDVIVTKDIQSLTSLDDGNISQISSLCNRRISTKYINDLPRTNPNEKIIKVTCDNEKQSANEERTDDILSENIGHEINHSDETETLTGIQDICNGLTPHPGSIVDYAGVIKSPQRSEGCFDGLSNLTDMYDDQGNKPDTCDEIVPYCTEDVAATLKCMDKLCSNEIPYTNDNDNICQNITRVENIPTKIDFTPPMNNECYVDLPTFIPEDYELIKHRYLETNNKCENFGISYPIVDKVLSLKYDKPTTELVVLNNNKLNRFCDIEDINLIKFDVNYRCLEPETNETPNIERTNERNEENEIYGTLLEDGSIQREHDLYRGFITKREKETITTDNETENSILRRDMSFSKDPHVTINNAFLGSTSTEFSYRGKNQPNVDLIMYCNKAFDDCTNALCSKMSDLLFNITVEKNLLYLRSQEKDYADFHSDNYTKSNDYTFYQNKIKCFNRLFLQVYDKICIVTVSDNQRKHLLIELFVRIKRRISSIANRTWTLNETRLQLITFMSKDVFSLPLVAATFFKSEKQFSEDCFTVVDTIREGMSFLFQKDKEQVEVREERDLKHDINRGCPLSKWQQENTLSATQVGSIWEDALSGVKRHVLGERPSDYGPIPNEKRSGPVLQKAYNVSSSFNNGLLSIDTVQYPNNIPKSTNPTNHLQDISRNIQTRVDIDNNLILRNFEPKPRTKTNKSTKEDNYSCKKQFDLDNNFIKEKQPFNIYAEHNYTKIQSHFTCHNSVKDCDEYFRNIQSGNVRSVAKTFCRAKTNCYAEKLQTFGEYFNTEAIDIGHAPGISGELEFFTAANLNRDHLRLAEINSRDEFGILSQNEKAKNDYSENKNIVSKHESNIKKWGHIANTLSINDASEKESRNIIYERSVYGKDRSDNDYVLEDVIKQNTVLNNNQDITVNRFNTDLISPSREEINIVREEGLNTTWEFSSAKGTTKNEVVYAGDLVEIPLISKGTTDTEVTRGHIPVSVNTKHIEQIKNDSDPHLISQQRTISGEKTNYKKGLDMVSVLTEINPKYNRNEEPNKSDTPKSQQGYINHETKNELTKPALIPIGEPATTETEMSVSVGSKIQALYVMDSKIYNISNDLKIPDTRAPPQPQQFRVNPEMIKVYSDNKYKAENNPKLDATSNCKLPPVNLPPIKTQNLTDSDGFLVGETRSGAQKTCSNQINKTVKGRISLKPIDDLKLNNDVNADRIECTVKEPAYAQNEFWTDKQLLNFKKSNRLHPRNESATSKVDLTLGKYKNFRKEIMRSYLSSIY